MFTKENTDVDILKENYNKLEDRNNNANCVLITTGSFNPIHHSHIRNLSLVRDHLESLPPDERLNVLAGYISPTHDSYVQGKLRDTDFISGKDRCDLCESAIKHEGNQSWMAVTRGEVNSNRFADFDEVTIKLERFLNSEDPPHPLKVVYVCGLDHFNKCRHVARLAKEKNVACAVIYRPGAADGGVKIDSPNIYYISLENELGTLVDISSTAIRARYQNPENTADDGLIYPSVHEFLKKKYSKS